VLTAILDGVRLAGVAVQVQGCEFARGVLNLLRQPLRDGQIRLTRSGRTVRFPARFLLAAGMIPCPCGGLPYCACTPLQSRRYWARLTETLGRHLPIRLTVIPPATTGSAPQDEAHSAARVVAARERARARLRGTPWRLAAQVPGPVLGRDWASLAGAVAPIGRAVDLACSSSTCGVRA
jgi:magnesium chelatase family protein